MRASPMVYLVTQHTVNVWPLTASLPAGRLPPGRAPVRVRKSRAERQIATAEAIARIGSKPQHGDLQFYCVSPFAL